MAENNRPITSSEAVEGNVFQIIRDNFFYER
jgi:hypothetical protein